MKVCRKTELLPGCFAFTDRLLGLSLSSPLLVDIAEITGKIDSGHLGDIVNRRQALNQAGNEICGRRALAITAALVPNGYLVNFEVLDCLDLGGNDLLDFLGHKESGGGPGITITTLHQSLIAFDLTVEHYRMPFSSVSPMEAEGNAGPMVF